MHFLGERDMVRNESLNQLRRYTRYPIGVTFKLRENGEMSSGEVLFDTINVSGGGAFLRSELLLDVGAEVEVTFSLPNSEQTVSTTARVAWVTRGSSGKREPGMGIEFISLAEKERGLIEDLIQRRLSEST